MIHDITVGVRHFTASCGRRSSWRMSSRKALARPRDQTSFCDYSLEHHHFKLNYILYF
jgi:hypothetical protein